MTSMVREAVIEYRGRNQGPKIQVRTADDVAAWAIPLIGSRVQESFLVCALNARHQITSYCEIGRGTATNCAVERSSVMRFLLLAATPAVIFVHNHPSDDCTPSYDDVELTKKLVECCDLFGIHVVDHVIVSESGHTSMREAGLLPMVAKSKK